MITVNRLDSPFNHLKELLLPPTNSHSIFDCTEAVNSKVGTINPSQKLEFINGSKPAWNKDAGV